MMKLYIEVLETITQTTTLAPDWIMALASAGSLIVAAVVAYYAKKTVGYTKATIEEARKNRRKDTIERQLENVYSPLYEILRENKFGNLMDADQALLESEVTSFKGSLRPDDYVLEGRVIREVHEIIRRFGHYMNSSEHSEWIRILDKSTGFSSLHVPGYSYYLLINSDMAPRIEHIERTRRQLIKELEELTNVQPP